MVSAEQISALLDNEAAAVDVDAALVAAAAEPAVREVVSVYQLIKDALSGNVGLDHGYSQRILLTMEQRGLISPRARP